MELSKLTKVELLNKCSELDLKNYKSKNKSELIKLISDNIKNDKDSKKEHSENKIKIVDLFTGTGAFTLAFESFDNVECVFANDYEDSSKIIYDANFNHKLVLKDLNEIDPEEIPPHNILTGGFPCQPFSIAGKREGFNDKRSNVFWKILEIIDFHGPEYVILENVKNLTTHDNNKTFETIKTELIDRGYFLTYKVLNTSDITGIPQNRERIYIVCIKNKMIHENFSLDFKQIEKKQIIEMLEDDVNEKYYYTEKSKTWPLVKEGVIKKNTLYQYRRVYVRENKSSECPTLTANMGTGGHNVPLLLDDKGIRKLTPRECFNFQGFPKAYKLPDTLSDAKLYKLAGNAVTVKVVKMIATRLINLINST